MKRRRQLKQYGMCVPYIVLDAGPIAEEFLVRHIPDKAVKVEFIHLLPHPENPGYFHSKCGWVSVKWWM